MVYKTICSVSYPQLNAWASIMRLEKLKKQACWCFSCSFSRVEDTQQRAQGEHGHRNGKQRRHLCQDMTQVDVTVKIKIKTNNLSVSHCLCAAPVLRSYRHESGLQTAPVTNSLVLLYHFPAISFGLFVRLWSMNEDCWHYFSTLLLSALSFHSTWFSCRRRFFIFPEFWVGGQKTFWRQFHSLWQIDSRRVAVSVVLGTFNQSVSVTPNWLWRRLLLQKVQME